MTDAKKKNGNGTLKKFAAAGGSAGVGVVVAMYVFNLVKGNPDLLLQAAREVPLFLLGIGALVLLDRWAGKFVGTQQEIADGIKAVAAQSTHLDAIEASLGSMHGKVDELKDYNRRREESES